MQFGLKPSIIDYCNPIILKNTVSWSNRLSWLSYKILNNIYGYNQIKSIILAR